MDYFSPGGRGSRYALTGSISTNPLVTTSPNVSYPSVSPHIYLNIFHNTSNTVVLSKAYIANDEMMLLPDCHHLGTYYRVSDVKKTFDGGYIICGDVAAGSGSFSMYFRPYYHNPFILKVDAAGTVMWYKRYNSTNPNSHLGGFNSIIEHQNGYWFADQETMMHL